MKPYVIAHMASTLDGRISGSRWSKAADVLPVAHFSVGYEEIHQRLKGDAWIVGRTTMAEIADGNEAFKTSGRAIARTTFKAPRGEGHYAIVVDPHGKVHWTKNTANGDAAVEVLTEKVADAYLEELQSVGVSYLFAGVETIDLATMLEKLHAEFGIKRLLLEGGGGINGTFVAEGLVDELSLMIIPLIDSYSGAPVVFHHEIAAAPPAPMSLDSVERLADDVIWLRYSKAAAKRE